MKPTKKFLAAAIFSLTLIACAAQRPILYPNQHLQRVGNNTADREVDECRQRAEEYVSSGAGRAALEQAAVVGGRARS
jgi:outer membrane lipoprotein SlyB